VVRLVNAYASETLYDADIEEANNVPFLKINFKESLHLALEIKELCTVTAYDQTIIHGKCKEQFGSQLFPDENTNVRHASLQTDVSHILVHEGIKLFSRIFLALHGDTTAARSG
jgi:hypothetical protein